ncbi:hypothetical protein FRC04_011016 [Tulasnella sp. 424]|nr:hypothetical protein FRC04_011016 [Tulasnella sp. 424]KAG8978339.1 hypothetical protein FRC05_010584 [Tulasnella sp. 425]
MPLKAAASYEVSLRAHKDPEVGRRLRPAYPPFWVEPRELNRHYTLSYIFYDDPLRGALLHARETRSQAFPINRDDAPALDPSRCKGVWYLPAPELAQRLKGVEADMLETFQSIKVGDLRGNAMPLAGYLRQLYDHFLFILSRASGPRGSLGTFETPIPLNSVDEPHMKNALNNKARGQSYKVGAWMVDSPDAPGREEDQGSDSMPQRKRKRARETDTQSIKTSSPSLDDRSTGILVAPSQADDEQEVARKPKRLRLITSSSPKPDESSRVSSGLAEQSDDRSTASTVDSGGGDQESSDTINNGSDLGTPIDVDTGEGDAVIVSEEDNSDVELGNWEVFLFTDNGPIRLVGSEDSKSVKQKHGQIRYAPIPEAIAL